MHEHHHDHDKKVHLEVQTLSGTYRHEFGVQETLHHVVEETFKHLNIHPAKDEVWELRYKDVLLDQSQTIEHAHLPDCAELTLAPKEGGGGAHGPCGEP
jgi:hypothetical protein